MDKIQMHLEEYAYMEVNKNITCLEMKHFCETLTEKINDKEMGAIVTFDVNESFVSLEIELYDGDECNTIGTIEFMDDVCDATQDSYKLEWFDTDKAEGSKLSEYEWEELKFHFIPRLVGLISDI